MSEIDWTTDSGYSQETRLFEQQYPGIFYFLTCYYNIAIMDGNDIDGSSMYDNEIVQSFIDTEFQETVLGCIEDMHKLLLLPQIPIEEISEILDMVQIENGKVHLEYVKDVRVWLQDLLTLMEKAAKK